MAPYHPNFHSSNRGNAISRGSDLVVKIDGAAWTSGILYRSAWLGLRKKYLQIEQTGTKNNPERNQVTFEMKAYDKKTKTVTDMPPGKYGIIIYLMTV